MTNENAPRREKVITPNLLTAANRLPEETIKRTVKNPRNARLINKLVTSKGLTSKQVGLVTGASNPYGEIEKLRKLGWEIEDKLQHGTDRDNRPCHYVHYHLSPLQLEDAYKVVELKNTTV